MASSDSLQTTPRKSKRLMNLTSKSDSFQSNKLLNQASKLPSANPDSPIFPTPEKRPSVLPIRARNRGLALSNKEIRKVAQNVPRKENNFKSARKQILSATLESPLLKSTGDAPIKLPQNYKMLCDFFHGLDSAIRLSRMKGSMSTFANICPQVERLTDRRFSYGHLAQLKHILPEAIDIKRVLKFDERSSCMKPDLHIAINADTIGSEAKSKSESKNMDLRKLFRMRIEDFHKAHPEGDEIPEEDLPEPFNRSKEILHSNVIKTPTSSTQADADKDQTEPESPNHSTAHVTKTPCMLLAILAGNHQ